MCSWLLTSVWALLALPASAYSVLTHETIIDAAWVQSIQPLLEARFHPSPEELKRAHAYAYGGCIIQDAGYYPFGSKFFSDMAHYVRSGKFVLALLDSASNTDEYAFALGALAHYFADTHGHPLAVNPSVALLYPKLRRRYGAVMLYEQNPAAHMRTEFGFDVVQVAAGHYAPEAYRDFIGFEVAKPVLERAFVSVYGLELKDVFGSVDLALGTYRWAVSSIIPLTTKVAWEMKRDAITAAYPGITREKFLYNISRTDYERAWGREYRRPGIGARILAGVFRVLPKVGIFKPLAFRPPTPEAERLFMLSFNDTLAAYKRALSLLPQGLTLVNLDLDTGQGTHPGEYELADRTYAQWLERLAAHHFKTVTPAIRADILRFYTSAGAAAARRHSKRWQRALADLKALPDTAPAAP